MPLCYTENSIFQHSQQKGQRDMPAFFIQLLDKKWRPGRAAAAGLTATAAYSVAMETDQYITGNRFNDIVFLQGLLGDKDASSKRSAGLAWGLHFFTGAMLGEIYAAVVKRLLPGPDWLKGAIFGGGFIAAAWTLSPFVDRYHPLVKNGRLPHLATWTSFWQNVLRHLVFGITLGLLYRERQ
jgi:hypothetical protein